ncbi:MAG: hypothetical protein K5924_12740 [Chloroflexi bacterium]|nr:hypothetical protein [Chloroflexota bacterium]
MSAFDRFDKMVHGWIERAVEATMPRQAVVSRAGDNGVWVRFAPVDPTVPEMWYPSTVAGLPAGTSGWVFVLGGGKGLFVATSPPRTIAAPPVVETGSITVNGAGTAILAQTTLTGLVPGVKYTVIISGSSRFLPQTLPANFSPRAIVDGINQANQYVSRPTGSPIDTSIVSTNWGGVVTAPASGSLPVGWGVTWNAGSSSFTGRFLTAIAIPV